MNSLLKLRKCLKLTYALTKKLLATKVKEYENKSRKESFKTYSSDMQVLPKPVKYIL